MATQAPGIQQRSQTNWIISARTDLLWFTLGGAASAYVFWALWRFAHVPLFVLVAIWAAVFDETHGFATISRTYLDAQERARRGRWLWWSVLFFFAIGPVLILLHLGDWLDLGTELWAYYHVYKQHYGFMMMYKVKNGDLDPSDNYLDRIFFAAAVYYPFFTYPLHNKEAAETFVPFPIPPAAARNFENFLLAALILITAVYLGRQFTKWREGLPLNWPKQILFLSVIPASFFVFKSGMPLIGVYAAATIYHDIQYHRLVWFYNQNKYGGNAYLDRQYGLARLVNSRWFMYLACAALYAAVFDALPRFILHPWLGTGSSMLGASLRNQLFFSLFAAPGLLHYWLDGYIWKVRSDPQLRTYLNLGRPDATAQVAVA